LGRSHPAAAGTDACPRGDRRFSVEPFFPST
jgi:hypothetical protein